MEFQKPVDALNSIADKPWAFLILLTGCVMLICCKKWGVDTTIAGGIIGAATNMLQNQIKHEENSNNNNNLTLPKS